MGIANHPNFPGWDAPLHLNPLRFEEFFSFTGTIVGTWLSVGIMLNAYTNTVSSSIPTALARTSLVWLTSMPVSAAQLVLLVAAEDNSLVSSEGWAVALPLAATGAGEPFVTAAGLLGLMTVWRAFYVAYLDTSQFLSIDGARSSKEQDVQHFWEALRAAIALSAASSALLYGLKVMVDGIGMPQIVDISF